MPDNTDVPHLTRVKYSSKEGNKFLQQYFRKPDIAECGHCKGREWWIWADDDPRSGMVMFVCKSCRRVVPPVELRKPQMNDDIARKTGLILPDPWLSSDRPGSPWTLDMILEDDE